MSEQTDKAVNQGTDSAKKAGKGATNVGGKAASEVAKKATKSSAKAASFAATFTKFKLIVLASLLVIILIAVVGGSSGPAMTKTESLTAKNEKSWNIPKTEEEKTASLYNKSEATSEATELFTIIHDKKASQYENAISSIKSVASGLGCDEDTTMQNITDETQFQIGASVSASTIDASENMLKTWKFLKGNGYSDEAAAGIMGNIAIESNFNPEAVNSLGATGICQWYKGRATKLKNYASSKDKSWKSIDIQLDYLLVELNTSYKIFTESGFKGSNDLSYTTDLFLAKFEVPAVKGTSEYDKEYANRIREAKKIYNQYKGMDANGVGSNMTISGASTADFDILATYSVSVGNGQLVLQNEEESKKESDGSAVDEGTYTDIAGNKIPLFWFGSKSGLPNYKKDLDSKLDSIKSDGYAFYTITYEKNSDGSYKYETFTNEDGQNVRYIKATIAETDISEDKGDGETLAKKAFNLDTEKNYQDTNSTLDEVIHGISDETLNLLGDGINSDVLVVGSGQFANPLGKAKYVITGQFNEGRDWDPYSTKHPGLDMAAPTGTPIYAASDGTVETAGIYGGYGYCVIINHGGGLKTIYGHQNYMGSNGIVVRKGQKVVKGQLIGHVGSTGFSTGPHLHFEIQKNTTPVNPLNYITR